MAHIEDTNNMSDHWAYVNHENWTIRLSLIRKQKNAMKKRRILKKDVNAVAVLDVKLYAI